MNDTNNTNLWVDIVQKIPVIGGLVRLANARPRLVMWAVLSAGIIVLLLVEARDVGLLAGNWAALMIASVLVAGLCVWIVSWEDPDESEVGTNEQPPQQM